MANLSSIVPTGRVRAGLAVVILALALVPTLARARQQVERRDATRLSIRHSWLGVMPPTKASVTPVPTGVLPPPDVEIGFPRVVAFVHVSSSDAPRDTRDDVSDLLRGPPPSRS